MLCCAWAPPACGEVEELPPPPAGADGGVLRSNGLGTCESPVVVEGREGEATVVLLDTTGGPPGRALLEIGWACALDVSDDTPQAVLAYRVPGSGLRTVRFTTDGEGTDPRFLTTVVVRRGSCGGLAPDPISDGCFDGSSSPSRHASGEMAAQGGDTLVFVVTGNRFLASSTMDSYEGRARLEITTEPASPPRLHAATVRVFSGEPALVRVDVEGEDRDADAIGVLLSFLDASKAPISWSPSTGARGFGAVGTFGDPPRRPDRFTARVFYDRAPAPLPADAWVQLVDAAGHLGERETHGVVGAEWRALGEPCDDLGLVCREELACSADTCAPTSVVAAACAAARTVSLDPPGTRLSSATFDATLPASGGMLVPSCTEGSGSEALYRVVVPEGSFDLVVADLDEGRARSALWVRRECTDVGSEAACTHQGDAMRHRLLEMPDVAPGPWVIGIDQFPLAAWGAPEEVPYRLLVGLRPVLETGESCDPAGWDNRCRRGPCGSGTARCP